MVDEHFKRGREFARYNQLDKAIVEFKKSLEVGSYLYFTYEQLGYCYKKKGQYEFAVKYYKLALEEFSEALISDKIHFEIGCCYSEKGENEEAVKYFNLAIKKAPKDVRTRDYYFNRALALKKLGKYDEAILDLKEVLKQDPKMSNAWTLKCNCHRAKREYEEAIKSLDKALEINPKNLLARRNKATILNIQGDEVKAQEILNKSLSIEPTDFQSWGIKGEQLMGSGNFEEALKCFNEAVKLSSGHPYDIQLREKCIQNQKQYKDIRKSLPQNSKGWNSRGVKLFSIGVCIEALGCFEEALRLEPDNYDFLMNKALTQKALARYRAALDGIEKLIRKKPNDALAWNDKGNIWFSLEQYDKAFNSYEKALEIDPNLTIAQNNKEAASKHLRLKDNILGAKGNDQNAVDTYNRTSENDSQKQLARENYAREKKKVSLDKEILALTKAFGESLYNYLENQGAAFTIKALEKRLDSFIEDLNERKYGRENLEHILNKLRAHGRINSAQHNGETHYFVQK